VFLALLAAGWRIGIVFFLWLGIFNVMVIAQFWAFAADVFSEEKGKRLFPLIGVGSSLGAWLGSVRAGQLVESAGPARLLAGAVGVLVVCAGLARSSTTPPDTSRHLRSHRRTGPGGGFAMVLGSLPDAHRRLVVLLNLVNTSGEHCSADTW
jgi:AAA family ATP:ADP antiporter